MQPHERAQWVSATVERHERSLVLYAHRLLGDPERARDIVQETFLRLCRQDRASVDDHLRAWLFTVCRNLVMDEFRRRKDVSPDSEALLNGQVSPDPSPDQVIERRDAAATALEALERLPPREREVVHLRYRGDLTYREIAAVTGHSVSYVGVLLYTAMKRLRGMLGATLQADAALATRPSTTTQGAIR
jgi:RNA polymerase sigma-70 factor (ECF subfamily)